MPIPAASWRKWAESDLFKKGLRALAKQSGISRGSIDALMGEASHDDSWRPLAALDATLRMVSAMHASGGFGRGDAERTLRAMWERTRGAEDPTAMVPAGYWTVRPASPVGSDEQVLVTGAVLVRVRGVRDAADRARREDALPREIAAALHEAPPGPGRHLLSLLKADGILMPATLLAALLIAATGVVVEALLFRSLIDLGAHLALSGQRLAAMAAIACLSALLLALELPVAVIVLGLGRRLEARLRVAFLEKIPRLADRYFQSRPTSDMAERGHAIHQIRELPNLGAQLLRTTFELVLTALGIGLLFPESAPLAVAAAVLALGIPALAQPWLSERDLRQRTHTGALTRFLPRRVSWPRAGPRARRRARARARAGEPSRRVGEGGKVVLRSAVVTSGVQLALGFGLAAWLLFARARLGDEGGGALLLAYWALNIPVLGQEIAQIAWQYPTQRNLTLRLLEPLGAIEEEGRDGTVVPIGLEARAGRRIDLDHVTVLAGGHTVLEAATLAIQPGAHVAIVGPSGAGKSTLVGLLLGWHRPVTGRVMVDGEQLEGPRLDALRRQTAWINPAVQLWNRSLIENLAFGNIGDPPRASARAWPTRISADSSSSFPKDCRRRSARAARWSPAARGNGYDSAAASADPTRGW